MRILVTGGGTGGHLYPALAVAEILMELDPGARILFVGSEEGLEAKVVPAWGFAFRSVATARWPRRLTARAWYFMPQLLKGYYQSAAIIKEWRPKLSLPLAVMYLYRW